MRQHLLIAPSRPSHLAVRQGDWVYIGARGGGGFNSRNVGDHGFGGPAATVFTGRPNSDIVDGKIPADAPQAQLYNLAEDPYQTTNVIRSNPEKAKELRDLMQRLRSNP